MPIIFADAKQLQQNVRCHTAVNHICLQISTHIVWSSQQRGRCHTAVNHIYLQTCTHIVWSSQQSGRCHSCQSHLSADLCIQCLDITAKWAVSQLSITSACRPLYTPSGHHSKVGGVSQLSITSICRPLHAPSGHHSKVDGVSQLPIISRIAELPTHRLVIRTKGAVSHSCQSNSLQDSASTH